MIQEDKNLLLKDLCARLPYGVIVQTEVYNTVILEPFYLDQHESLHPIAYLRPMSSMTEEEIEEFTKLIFISDSTSYGYLKECVLFTCCSAEAIDWLNQHHFDYRNLIGKELALEAPEGMY